MRWKKLGRVYVPDGAAPWMQTHAANPVAEHRGGDNFRIYFSSRDQESRSSISFVEIDLNDPLNVTAVAKEPVLSPGDLGMFDDSGCSIGCIVKVGERRYLYYMGWHLTVRVPWQNALGLAISEGPDMPFKRVSTFPVVPLDEVDPYTISYPWVTYQDGRFRMWYGSNLKWGARKEDMRHHIRYAESDDGIHWQRSGLVAVDFDSPDEYAMCKPCVLKTNADYEMWFCSRGNRYRIKYARSSDGISWSRHDADVGIDVSTEGWDSDMIEYPCVFDHNGERYMLYAGNEYGRSGFGIAVLEREKS